MNFTMYTNWCRSVKTDGIERAADYAKSLGFSSVEFFDFIGDNWESVIPDVATAKHFRSVLEAKGLHTACYSVAVCLYDPTSPDGINASAEFQMMKYAEYAAALGSPFLHHTVTLSIDEAPLPYHEMLKTVLPSVVRIAKYAASLGVRCIYEDQGMYFNGIEGLNGLVDKLKANGRKVGICADFGNSLFVDEAPAEVIGAFIDDVCHVHVKDYVVSSEPINGVGRLKSKGGKYLYDTEIGTGDSDVNACFELLKKIGYKGNISLEFDISDENTKKSMEIISEQMR